MLPSKDDPAGSLTDIIENAERIESYLLGMDRDRFADYGLVRDAVARCLERVCEAACCATIKVRQCERRN